MTDASTGKPTALSRQARAFRWQDHLGKTPYHYAASEQNVAFVHEVQKLQPQSPSESWLPLRLLDTNDLEGRLPISHARQGSEIFTELQRLKQEFEESRVELRKQVLARLDEWRIDGKLNIHEEIGRGQFGAVHRAVWQGTSVAVKKMFNNALTENAELFEKEIEMMKILHHPNVVQFLGFADFNRSLVIVMELFSEGSIEDYIQRHRGRLSHITKVRWCDEMSQAVGYLHNRKPEYLIHRDVKPSNFMLTESLKIKLGDFGVSRLFGREPLAAPGNPMDGSGSRIDDDSMTYSRHGNSVYDALDQTSNCGTVRFMAPEVHANDPSKGRSIYSRQADIFSLGLVFYFVFEEQLPRIPGVKNPVEHLSALQEHRRPLYARTRDSTRRIIDACIATDTRRRPTALEIIYLLRAVPTYRAFPLCCLRGRRHPTHQDEEEASTKVEEIYARLKAGAAGAPPHLSTSTSLIRGFSGKQL